MTKRTWWPVVNQSCDRRAELRGRGILVVVCAVIAACSAVAGCGGSGSAATTHKHISAAARVCAGAKRAAHPLLGSGVHLRIASADPTNIECVLDGNGVHVDAIAQATAVAWTEYDTAAVHQAQAFGTGAVHQRSQQPHSVPGLGGNSTWIPAKEELIATNGTESRGGSYLTVTVTRHGSHAPSSVAVAAAVGRTMLASAPRGPNPGPPPS
ncbi:MAG TPA: hypothetical protein VFB39_03865 [Solirubrobacteraceae bacterium]|nr:hypothetical protein [Solirubrobacteraceae bacterium]